MRYPIRSKQMHSMQTRDGVRLDADVYYPDSNEAFPVLLMRQPYGRAIASTVVYAHPSWYAAHGYIVVIQDVRGRGSSEGEFSLFAHEIEDGEDTVNWAAALPQSTGEVGMYGFSYQGMTQLYAAVNRPAALRTLCPSMIGYDLYQDWAYEGGAFCYQLNLGWAIQLAAETVRRQGDEDAYRTLYAAARNPPLSDPVDVRSGILKHFAANSHYYDWLAHPEPDEYWQNLSPCAHMQNVDLPMLHIGGWFDTYLRGTLRLYEAMASRSALPQQLIVGPWAHLPWGRKVGAVDYGVTANTPIDRLQIRWFDHWLKNIHTGLLDEAPVSLFEMGSNQWRHFEQFPAQPSQSYRIVTTGLAAMDQQEGQLERAVNLLVETVDNVGVSVFNQRSETVLPAAQPIVTPDLLVHDPWRPVPAQGGHAAVPAGAFDRSEIDCRSDVLTYTTAPLTEDLHLVGKITVELYCTADAPSFDLCAVLSEVKANGSVYNITQGYQRISAAASATPVCHTFALQPTCIRIPATSAVRLSLSAACFPAYAVNPGTETLSTQSRLMDAKVITVTMYGNSEFISQVNLPEHTN